MSSKRNRLKNIKTLVLKIGSALLTDSGRGLDREKIAGWVGQIASLHKQGVRIVLVSSGAVAEGMVRKALSERPADLPGLQAAAAIGQTGLIEAYQYEFSKYDLLTGQILLVHDDVVNEQRYSNAKATLQTLLDWGAIPIVNENDSVANEELKFGDNDHLAALVTNIIEADALIMLTDQQGLYDADPRNNPDATLIEEGSATDKRWLSMAGSGGKLGRGGMQTKVKAAGQAASTGADTVIAAGEVESIITRLLKGESVGTFLYAS